MSPTKLPNPKSRKEVIPMKAVFPIPLPPIVIVL